MEVKFDAFFEAINLFLASNLTVTLMTNGVLATFGAIANYLYANVHKKIPFKLWTFFVTAFLGFFVGNVVGSFLPHDFPFRDGTLMVSGFVCYPILALIETEFPRMVLARIGISLGVQKPATTQVTPPKETKDASGTTKN